MSAAPQKPFRSSGAEHDSETGRAMQGSHLDDARKTVAITEVAVDRLFDRYDYRLDFDPSLAILYGDNGTGKTTILRMIHNLLSPGPGRGHKTAVAKTNFKSFRIEFSNGATVRAEREQASVGSFELCLVLPSRKEHRAHFIVNDDGYIPRRGSAHSESQDDLVKLILQAIPLRSYYLSDDRTLDSDFIKEEEPNSRESLLTRYRYLAEAEKLSELADKPARYPQLTPAMTRVAHWARQQALQGASEGSVSANSIYADVVKHLAFMPRKSTSEGKSSTSRHQLLELIEVIGERSRDQSRFGLLPAVNTGDLLQFLPKVRDEDFSLVSGILKPYLDGTAARLDALESTHRVLSFFVDTLNRFFKGKYVKFDIKSGLTIYTDADNPLDAEALSSGESQLLTLFCNILSARESPTIFVIDEPEISLNVKWQRALVDALLGCAKESEIQLILATHSIELLATHREQVVRLKG
ncbi:AAA family ATPase [Streptomyces sp. NPDC008222]|uniref:AAA family ATPase n=1 Tax=Streptomyces sp. NPDC008222 TaxID=3364820 RepID=UPI0036E391F5